MENLKFYDFSSEIEDEEILEKEHEGFVVKDLGSADWCLRKIKENNDRAAERIEYAKAEIEKLKEYIKSEEYTRDESNLYLETLLQDYLFERRLEDPKYKLKTVTATVSTRKSSKWDYDDEKLIAFLKNNDMNEFVRVKEEIYKADLKKNVKVLDSGKVVTADGEIVEGVSVTDNVSLSIRFC